MTGRRRLAAAALALAVIAAGCSTGSGDDESGTTTTEASSAGPTTTAPLGSPPSPIPDGIRIEVLSSQADRISGDDVRIRITPPRGGSVDQLTVDLDGREVNAQLDIRERSLEGVVDGLVEGTNTLTVRHGDQTAVQRLRAWPITGPIISGPHLPLLACSTEVHGLGAPTDEDCSAPTQVWWKYIATDGTVKDVPADGSEPTDLARGEIDGTEVPLYVRHERGVINRSVYDLASIDANPGNPRDQDEDLGDDEADVTDDYTGPGWNGKLLYRFGGGCGTTYGQGTSSTNPLEPAFLRQGYAVATATFNTFQVQCNDVLSAETAMMVKERFIEEYGAPTFTIGEGASGGAIQLHLMTQNYPGIVNGAVAAMPFPDALSIAPGVTDCGLLLAYEETETGSKLTEGQRQAIAGHASAGTCAAWKASFLSGIDPRVGCDPGIDRTLLYDPVSNPTGLRCTLQDANRNQLGVDPDTGFARRPLDNVGIQYGLEAFNAGIIDFEQFADLNEQIGGYDLDGNLVPQRHEADLDTVLHAYETGRISMGGGDQAEVPIIDLNLYLDPTGDIHDRFRAFSLRDRLVRGRSPEQAPGFQIWTVDPASTAGTDTGANPLTAGTLAIDAVAVVDEWLTALIADDSGDPLLEVLARTRPEGAADRCSTVGSLESGVGLYDDPGPCRDDFPIAGDPRTAAGGPRSNEIIKCALKPVDPEDYAADLSGEQLARLAAAFPTGVCDWNQPGEGEVVPASPDRSYEDVQTPQQDA